MIAPPPLRRCLVTMSAVFGGMRYSRDFRHSTFMRQLFGCFSIGPIVTITAVINFAVWGVICRKCSADQVADAAVPDSFCNRWWVKTAATTRQESRTPQRFPITVDGRTMPPLLPSETPPLSRVCKEEMHPSIWRNVEQLTPRAALSASVPVTMSSSSNVEKSSFFTVTGQAQPFV